MKNTVQKYYFIWNKQRFSRFFSRKSEKKLFFLIFFGLSTKLFALFGVYRVLRKGKNNTNLLQNNFIMKRFIFLFLGAAAFALGVSAQPAEGKRKGDGPRDRKEASLKRAERMASRLDLEGETKQWFVPLYAEYQDTLAAVARSARPARAEGEGMRRAELTDMEAIETLARMFSAEEQTLALRREYFTRMKDRLTPQQLVVVFERGDYDGKPRPQQRSDGRRPNGGQFHSGGFGGGAPDGDFDAR